MRDVILQQIEAIEQKNSVQMLFVCESGSRAWGFASPDSDYDVRFIYVQPKNHYLSIKERRDVIEMPVDEVLDISGWDLRKALQLFLRSNATFYEWLQSPIVYKEKPGFAAELRGLMNDHFSHRAGCHHYLSMAYNTFENHLQGAQVKLKKYFYALRPALACLWIIEKQAVPPMEFGQLRTLVSDPDWQKIVDDLLDQKKELDERASIKPVGYLQTWVKEVLADCKVKADMIPAVKYETDKLDELFRKYLNGYDI